MGAGAGLAVDTQYVLLLKLLSWEVGLRSGSSSIDRVQHDHKLDIPQRCAFPAERSFVGLSPTVRDDC